MNPGAERLPHWVMGAAALLLVALIVVGGFWLQRMEKKARELEKQRAQPDDRTAR